MQLANRIHLHTLTGGYTTMQALWDTPRWRVMLMLVEPKVNTTEDRRRLKYLLNHKSNRSLIKLIHLCWEKRKGHTLTGFGEQAPEQAINVRAARQSVILLANHLPACRPAGQAFSWALQPNDCQRTLALKRSVLTRRVNSLFVRGNGIDHSVIASHCDCKETFYG